MKGERVKMTAQAISNLFTGGHLGLTAAIEQYTFEQLRAAREENERLRGALDRLNQAGANVLTGIGVHNAYHSDTPAKRANIEGPVISELVNALQKARAALNRPAAVPAVEGGGEEG